MEKKKRVVIGFGILLVGFWLLNPFATDDEPFPMDGIDSERPIAALDSVWLEELTWMEVRDLIKDGTNSIIVATGGVEQNGPFVALGKHNYILEAILPRIARSLEDTLIAPIIKYVPEGRIAPAEGHMQFAGTLSLREKTFEALLLDSCRSLAAHGFQNIILLGDSGGNQIVMAQVAATLNKEWELKRARLLYIPEFYNYELLYKSLAEQGYQEEDHGIHDNLAFTAQLLAINPQHVRMSQRLDQDLFSLNGIPLEPVDEFIELGEQIMNQRVRETVGAIEARID